MTETTKRLLEICRDKKTAELEELKKLLAEDCDKEVVLLCACANNFTEAALILIDAGAKANLQDAMGQTALHKACINKNAQLITQLMLHKANPDIEDNNGKNPFRYCRDAQFFPEILSIFFQLLEENKLKKEKLESMLKK